MEEVSKFLWANIKTQYLSRIQKITQPKYSVFQKKKKN
jgi:hypothetical protein